MTHTRAARLVPIEGMARCLLGLAMAMLTSCESTRSLMPALRAPEDMGMTVRFQPASDASGIPLLALIDIPSGQVLASSQSRFTPEVVQAVGVPGRDRFLAYASLSGDTIAAWEDASDSVPDVQVVVFKRDHHPDGRTSWYARSLFPPSRDARPYPIYGKPATVDDEYLYYTIEDGPDEKAKWTSLDAVPPGYKPKPIEVDEEDAAKEAQSKSGKPEPIEGAKIEQAPM